MSTEDTIIGGFLQRVVKNPQCWIKSAAPQLIKSDRHVRHPRVPRVSPVSWGEYSAATRIIRFWIKPTHFYIYRWQPERARGLATPSIKLYLTNRHKNRLTIINTDDWPGTLEYRPMRDYTPPSIKLYLTNRHTNWLTIINTDDWPGTPEYWPLREPGARLPRPSSWRK